MACPGNKPQLLLAVAAVSYDFRCTRNCNLHRTEMSSVDAFRRLYRRFDMALVAILHQVIISGANWCLGLVVGAFERAPLQNVRETCEQAR